LDFDTSEYFREQETMGKDPQPEHALENKRIVVYSKRMKLKNCSRLY